MPLSHLFSKRSSQKNKKAKDTPKEASETMTKVEEITSVFSEVSEVLNELVNTVSEETIAEEETEGDVSPLPADDVSNFVDQEKSDSILLKKDSLQKDLNETSSEFQKKSLKTKIRSVSESETEIEHQTKSVRRKFGSEGEILSLYEKIIPPEQRKELNEAIGKYIDKLIKDSIFKAVKSVNVDSLCEDIMKDFSNRKSSQSTESEEDFIVEQRLSSDSISELVELDTPGENLNKLKDDHRDSLLSDSDGKASETESLENEVDDIDHASFGGYLADLDDTTSVDDLKSVEEDSLNNSFCSGSDSKSALHSANLKSSEITNKTESSVDNEDSAYYVNSETLAVKVEAVNDVHSKREDISQTTESISERTISSQESISETKKTSTSEKETVEEAPDCTTEKNVKEDEQKLTSHEISRDCDQKLSSTENVRESEGSLPIVKEQDQKLVSSENDTKTVDLIAMSPEEESLLLKSDLKAEETKITPLDIDESLPQQKISEEEPMKVNWKVGNLHIKLPHKTRGKAHLKAWKKRRVIIQPDEFANDPKNPSLVISVYGADSKKHETTFWYSLSSQKAVVFRSSSRTHRYAFTISEGGQAIIHLSAENESATQEWMAAIRAVLWPPSPFMELEKMLSGREFEISIIDNEFSYHAGLLGMYGYLSITPKKLILLHPQQGYVIQEWYLNTVDKFHFVPQPKADDEHKVLCMTTCRDSSTGQGELIFFCNEAVTLLQSLASNIHQVLSYHSKQEGGKYQKELEEIAEWLVAPPQDCLNAESDEYYKVPPRQVKSLLDIPNFIFNKSLSPVASAIYPAPNSAIMEPLDATKNKQTTTSHDSGISTCTSNDDFLNCSVTSFVIGGGPMTGKSSDSELSDAYTPPRTPEMKKKVQCEVVKEEQMTTAEE